MRQPTLNHKQLHTITIRGIVTDLKLFYNSTMLILLIAVTMVIVPCHGEFDHTVTPSCPPEAEECLFEWTLSQKETMVWYNLTQNKGYPVLPNKTADDRYQIRTGANCSHSQPLSAQQMADVASADGTYRRAYFINDQFPGPSIVVYEGQQVVVEVTSKLLQEGLSIHWHGMVQRNTPWMDGVAGLTQCAINPEETFTYRFLAEPAGTHWYHSHVGAQRTDGLFGALVVLPRPGTPAPPRPTPLPDFHGDFLLMVQDWYHKESSEIWTQYFAELQQFWDGYSDLDNCHVKTQMIDGSEVGTLPFEAGLINGKGHFFKKKGVKEEVDVPLETFKVERGQHYRFRGINPALNFAFQISIDNHQLHVISSDGNDIEEIVVDEIIIHGGERYDFYIKADQPVDNYWIRAITIEKFVGLVTNSKVQAEAPGRITAILRYQGAKITNPTSDTKNCTADNVCHFVNCPYSEYPDEEYIMCHNYDVIKSLTKYSMADDKSNVQEEVLNFHFPVTPEGPLRSSINDIQFVLPDKPPQVYGTSDYSAPCDKTCEDTHCRCPHQINLEHNNIVQLVLLSTVTPTKWVGVPASAHPVHLHGHHFNVMKVAYPILNNVTKRYERMNPDITCPTDRQNNCTWTNQSWVGGDIPGMNVINPPLKDTVIVPVGGYVVIRFKADNPGWWILHCHVEIHQIEGMALIMQEGADDLMNPPPDNFPRCGSFKWSSADFKEKLKGRQPDFWQEHGIKIIVPVAVVFAIALTLLLSHLCKNRKSIPITAESDSIKDKDIPSCSAISNPGFI